MNLPAQKFLPIADKVILQVVKVTETAKGISLPDTVKLDSYQTPMAWVIAVGPDCKQVKRGDLVLITAETVAHKIRHGDDQFVTCSEKQILGVMDKEYL